MPCIQPMFLRKQEMVVPCGKCLDCRNRRVQSWVFRLLQQEKLHGTSVFATLTYSPETIRRTKNGFATLEKKDVQNFFKRLRKNTGKKTIKYYACGEYGTRTMRPHYHAIIFDTNYDEVEKAWGMGQIHIGDTRGESIAYVTKYICKPKKVPMHKNDDRQPEFSLMSKGMGSNYLTPQMIKYYHEGKISYVTQPGGFKQALPRYYRDRIFTIEQRSELNKAAQISHLAEYDKAVTKAGGINAYYYNRKAAIKSAMEIYLSQKNAKRDKL